MSRLAEILPHFNAVMNTTSAVALLSGYIAIRNKRVDLHWKSMLTAVIASAIFLVGYLTRFALTGVHKFPDAGAIKTVYFVLLFSHMVLAVAVVPIVLRLLYLAKHERFEQHKRLARVGWPIWMYVSVTGVVVYGMLYHLAPRLA